MSEASTATADATASTASPGDRASDATGSRLGAYLVDFVLLAVASFVIFIGVLILGSVIGAAAGAGMDDPQGVSTMMSALGFIFLAVVWFLVGVVVFGYFAGLDARGGTLGKRLLGLQVVADDGSPATFRDTAIRTVVLMAPFPIMALVGILLGILGFVVALVLMAGWLVVEAAVMFVSDDGQRLGDRLAGTYVVGT